MNKNILITLCSISILAILLTGCIKKEGLNVEADIDNCWIVGDGMKGDPVIHNEEILILANGREIDRTKVKLAFELTPGAVITPASGTERDFTKEVKYTVTSQDGEWSKTYTVDIIEAEIPTNYYFEHWKRISVPKKDGQTDVKPDYEIPYEAVDMGGGRVGEMTIWSSGNAGFSILTVAKTPYDFPTFSTPDSFQGSTAAKLVTRATNTTIQSMRIAAGNLFIGTFFGPMAMLDPMKATRFGLPFGKKPLRLQGHYKYKAGDEYRDKKGNLIEGKRDECSIYAVFYERGDGEILNGANVLTDPRLIYVAKVDTRESDEYIEFDIPFETRAGGPVFDQAKLDNFEYYFSVVFSASVNGASFEGAIDSTLYIDDVHVVCEGDDDQSKLEGTKNGRK